MRVFVTGGTGYIGSAVVRELARAGHQVTGLVRSRERRAALERLGASAVEGTLATPDAWRDAAAGHEALVHMAFDYSSGPATDRSAVEGVLGAAARGGTRVVVYTSGVWVLGDTGEAGVDESASTSHPAAGVAWRPAHERMVLDAATDRLATAVIRPGLVYGGQGGLMAMLLFGPAVTEGAALTIGEGRNHWPFVHREDLAVLYRLTVEKAARGVVHGVDNVPVRQADAARAASEAAGKGGKLRAMPLEEARARWGAMADALAMNQVVRTRRAAELGWRPAHPPFPAAAKAAFSEFTAGA